MSEAERQSPAFALALGDIARDDAARERYLQFAEDADLPRVRARMIQLAVTLGWLSPADQPAELVRMVGDLIERGSIGPAEVELVCSLNDHGALTKRVIACNRRRSRPTGRTTPRQWLVWGIAAGRARVLRALTSQDDTEVQLAQVYLSHHPITDVDELRLVASGITRMPRSGAQVRALDTLARHRLSDRQSLNELARLFPTAGSVDVQRAIAAVLIRADYQAIAKPEVARVLSQNRLKSPDGADIIDILIRRLQAP